MVRANREVRFKHFQKRHFKTGSKSCSAALRVLGYNVADYLETCEDGFQMPASDSLICRTSDWLKINFENP